MKAFLKRTWPYQALFIIFIVITALVVALVREEQNYKHLRSKFHESIQTAALKSAALTDTKARPTKVSYKKWLSAEQLADHFVQKSHGKFKKPWGLFLVIQARRHQIDPKIVYQLLRLESGGTFNPHMVGPKTKYGRAYGMAQFMTNTAPWIAKMAGMSYEKKKLFNPYYSIELAITYLDFLHDRYGDWNKALTAYNRGIYGLKTYEKNHGNSKSRYAMTIRQRAEKANVSYVPGG